jgi:hypothetical protein
MEIINKDKLSVLRKYFYESVLMALSVCVVTLFLMYNDLNKYIRTTLTEQIINNRITIQDNTLMMNETKLLINKRKNYGEGF